MRVAAASAQVCSQLKKMEWRKYEGMEKVFPCTSTLMLWLLQVKGEKCIQGDSDSGGDNTSFGSVRL